MTVSITRARLATLAPDEAAALFLVRQDDGASVEAGLFEEWLAQSAENEAAWDAATRAWSLFDEADDPVLAALRESALAAPKASRFEEFRTHWRPAAAAVAVLALVAGGIELGRGNRKAKCKQPRHATPPPASGSMRRRRRPG